MWSPKQQACLVIIVKMKPPTTLPGTAVRDATRHVFISSGIAGAVSSHIGGVDTVVIATCLTCHLANPTWEAGPDGGV